MTESSSITDSSAPLRFWQWRFPNPFQCCLPDNDPFHYQQLPDLDNAAKPSSLSPTKPSQSKSDDAGIPQLFASVNALYDGADRQLNNLRLLEKEKVPPPTLPPHIDPKSRAHCIDRLIDAAGRLHSTPATLHLAVNFFDRYLSQNHVEVEHLHLVGLTCLMVASQYDGVPDQFHAYLRHCHNTIRHDDLIRTETRLLTFLDYDNTAATAWSFLKRFVAAARGGGGGEAEEGSKILECMASYIAEVSLVASSMLPFLPSMVAASSVFLARYVLEPSKKPWSGALRRCTMYQPCDLRDCVVALHDCCYGRSSYYLPAVTIKYSKKKFHYVALKSAPRSIPLHVFEDLST